MGRSERHSRSVADRIRSSLDTSHKDRLRTGGYLAILFLWVSVALFHLTHAQVGDLLGPHPVRRWKEQIFE